MSSRAEKRRTRVYEYMRRVSTESLTIRLWIAANEDQLQGDEAKADEIASLVHAMCEEVDDPMEACYKVVDVFQCINAVEAIDDDGDGALIYPEWP